MSLHRERLPADPPGGPIVCRTCLRKLSVYGFLVTGPRPSWRCRRCAVRRAIALGMTPGEAQARCAPWL